MRKTTSKKSANKEKSEQSARYPKVNFRIKPLHEERLNKLIGLLKETNPFIDNVDVYHELMSLTNRGLITPEMRQWLASPATGDEFQIEKVHKKASGMESEASKKKA
jgi:hypothetical protein